MAEKRNGLDITVQWGLLSFVGNFISWRGKDGVAW